MTPFLEGFLKEAGALGAAGKLGKFIMKHPLLSFGAVTTTAATGIAAKAGYKRGRAGGQKPRYIAASYDPISRRAMPSRAALINYNPLFNKRLTEKQKKKLHKYYKEETFKR